MPDRAGHLPDEDRRDWPTSCSRPRRRVRVRGDGHQQRAPGAAGAQGARAAGRGAGRHLDHRAAREAARRDWGEVTPREPGTSCGRSRRCTPACATSGSRSSAASSGPAPTRSTRARCSCTRGCGRTTGERGPQAPFSVVPIDPPVDELTEEFPIRLTTGRRLDSYNTGVQTGGYASPLRRGETLDLSPEDAERSGSPRASVVRVISRRGAVEVAGARRSRPAPGLAFMTLHFPDEVETNLLTIDATDPKSGTAEFKAAAIRIEKISESVPAAVAPTWTSYLLRRRAPPTTSAPRSTRCSAPPSLGLGGRRARPRRDGRVARGGHEAREQRHLLLPALHAVQARVGWISPGGLNYVCAAPHGAAGRGLRRRDVLRAVRDRAAAATVVHVCDDIACRTRAREAVRALERRARPGRAADGRGPTWSRSPCLGLCERAPAVLRPARGRRARDVALALARRPRSSTSRRGLVTRCVRRRRRRAPRAADRRPTREPAPAPAPRRAWSIRPRSTTTARTAATRRCGARSSSGPTGVIREVTDAKLLGPRRRRVPRPGVKWEAVAKQPVRPHYVVCNADESEPGTFKDRVLMEDDPFARDRGDDDRRVRHRLRSRATSTSAASTRWRRARLEHAIDEARARTGCSATTSWARASRSTSSCGAAPAPTSAARRPRCSTRSRASAASRATSRRSRSQRGLFGKPTGDQQRRDAGQRARDPADRRRRRTPRSARAGSTGPRLFCLSGCVERPGVYEVAVRRHARAS